MTALIIFLYNLALTQEGSHYVLWAFASLWGKC